jgi:2-C-methyl-D-erythritol 2,4-cyclodiphosphate synthase
LKSADLHAVRTGFGYDVHRLVPGRRLMLGGVEIPSPMGLDGHSDADVLLHAICDALLGAAALDDIGKHFPNTDPRYRNISSLLLLEHVGKLLESEGYALVNIDAMLILERPKVLPYAEAMRAAIAGALGVTPDRIALKATSSEGMGFVGRSEGAAAHAVATIVRI